MSARLQRRIVEAERAEALLTHIKATTEAEIVRSLRRSAADLMETLAAREAENQMLRIRLTNTPLQEETSE